jgi:hypothetical protein
VQAQSGKQLTVYQANQWISAANQTRSLLGCRWGNQLDCSERQQPRRQSSEYRDLAQSQVLFFDGRQGAWMREPRNGNDNEQLSDDALLQREESERREYLRLEDREPHLRDTNYQELTGSKALLHAWKRWSITSIAVKLRGLISRGQ